MSRIFPRSTYGPHMVWLRNSSAVLNVKDRCVARLTVRWPDAIAMKRSAGQLELNRDFRHGFPGVLEVVDGQRLRVQKKLSLIYKNNTKRATPGTLTPKCVSVRFKKLIIHLAINFPGGWQYNCFAAPSAPRCPSFWMT